MYHPRMRHAFASACLLSSLACTNPPPAQDGDGSGTEESGTEDTGELECDEGTFGG